jgi:UDP-galactopyranose mutase
MDSNNGSLHSLHKGSSAINNDTHDLVCFSHLRWDFVFQRPQHLLTRFAKNHRLFYVEEPFYDDISHGYLFRRFNEEDNVTVVTPHLPSRNSQQTNEQQLNTLLKEMFLKYNIENYIFWYYTPMALPFTRSFTPAVTVFDCMDELSAFAGAPAELKAMEKELLGKADIVFTGGRSLYEAKKDKHHNVHCFPSSIDKHHFEQARTLDVQPDDQKDLPSPRIGYYGVIDERMDLELLDKVSRLKPDWHFIMVGPVVKIDPAALPKNPNIHYVGQRKYAELPQYLAGWDAAMMPFARNESTKFISPTKVPEYLAAGRPVISTSIRDVVRPYGEAGLVSIADAPEEFVKGIEKALTRKNDSQWLREVDDFLADNSWNNTWNRMNNIICEVLNRYRAIDRQPDIAPETLSA